MADGNGEALRMIRDSRLHHPDPARAALTNCGSIEAFQALLKRSREQPEEFWADVANELEWMRPWDVVFEGRFPHFKYFVGGISNPTLNLIDRHLVARRGQPSGPHLGGRRRAEPILHLPDALGRSQQVRQCAQGR